MSETRAGFTLVEVLVALVVAGLFLAVLGRAMAEAWSASRAPMDVVGAVILARDAALGAPNETFRAARARGYQVERSSSGAVTIIETPSGLAPAPVDRAKQQEAERPKTTPAAMLLAAPKGVSSLGANAPKPHLRRVSVTVSTPLGRRLRFETIRIEAGAP